MNDVVDALLDDHRVGAVGGHFVMEPVITGEAVGLDRKSVV